LQGFLIQLKLSDQMVQFL